MTPRRSSRARTSQPSPAILQHTNSSSSSASLTRERSTRSNAKNPSPQGSSGHRSQSIDDADAAKLDFPQTRQRQRARGDEEIDKIAEVEKEEGEEDEEEEITRCLCGQQEYPGLPPSRRDLLGRNGMHGRVKDDPILNFSADSSDLMSDEIGSMFIQCDQCKVWQHGGCVGIMDEAMSPDEYFCEECRKDLHRIKNESNGQYSSQYLPVAPPSPASSSRDSSRDNSKRTKDSKSRQNDPSNPKRRHKQAAKRQRTSSPSPGATSNKQSNPVSQPASEDEKAKAATNGTRRQRAASRSQHNKETKDVEEPEAEQPDATNRRKGRSDRRKGDVATNLEPPQPSPDTTAPAPEPAPSRPSTRKSVGRNQYTRDRDVNGNGDSSFMMNSPRRGQSHDTNGDSPRVGGANGTYLNGSESGKPSRPRYVNQRTTMNEMKRRVAAILEFISRMQVEMASAGESTTPPGVNSDRLNGILMKAVSEQLENAMASTVSEADSGTATTDGENGAVSTEKEFKDLSSVEMMDVLTRHLLKWQQEYGKFGER
ncbi:PHD Zn-finger protein [Aspergillus oryzae 3.042]|uniref:PHD Zn-finger protein n=1 Tax=Aspergillus oryzae (strain 3.042) TaxID=1160506 RepID=I8TQ01_ASPO3|nr:PHD Zn-finger protein [Aspergillus oryzae 3.042]|eukprot:EIT76325.1 PHD Zn-finger protein [Aspergillus oryzae 3.042]